MRPQSEILKDIARFEPVGGLWLPLDDLLSELWLAGQPKIDALPILFGVLERFPADDGAGVFWSIVHGIESLPYDYEPLLRDSIDRVPAEISKVMLHRLSTSKGTA